MEEEEDQGKEKIQTGEREKERREKRDRTIYSIIFPEISRVRR